MTAAAAAGPLRIIPVESKAEMTRFIRLPSRIAGHDPNWITPLEMEREEALSPKKNPLFAHTEVKFWLAVRDGRDVGRISAQVSKASSPGGTGHFGMIAADDDPAIFQALFATAEGWLKAKGMREVLGPFNLSINEETGVLVKGFDTPPMLMMGHDLPYVATQIEALGYAKAKDLYAYVMDITQPLPRSLEALTRRPLPPNFRLRHLSFKQYQQDIESITSIFNDAWSENWRFEPLTAADTDHLAKAMRPILSERMVWFVDIDDVPVAFGVSLPNINEALHGLDGKLLPFGWAKLLWRLKVKKVKTARVPLMGVRRQLSGLGLAAAAIPVLIIDAMRTEARKLGYERAELSWILEDNLPMRHLNEAVGGVAYKTYRVYGKPLA